MLTASAALEEVTVDKEESNGVDDAERRATPRFGISAQVRLHGEESWSGVYQTADLSVSGAFLISDSPPPRGSMVKLDLELNADNTFQGLEALVVHVRTEATEPSARGCGVMFVRLAKDQAESLRTAVSEKLDD